MPRRNDEPAFYEVRNWQQFQHYKDRNPAWIKLHFALLQSEDWVTLADASKLLAVVCMLLASRNSGRVPNNPAYIKRVAFLDRLPNLKPLIECGFLSETLADASGSQASAPKRLSRGEERRGDLEEPIGSSAPETENTVSGLPSKKKAKGTKRPSYPLPFDELWKAYPTTRNMSKSDAFNVWSRLSAEDKALAAKSIPSFLAFCKANPTYPVIYLERYLSKRRFEGHAEDGAATATDDDWQKRLGFGRAKCQWSSSEWGPAPGQPGCQIPAHLLQPGDGAGWAEWKPRASEPAQ